MGGQRHCYRWLYVALLRVTSAMRSPNRRQLLSSIATLTAGGVGYSIATDEADAQTSLNLTSFDIPDHSSDVTGPVSGLSLDVDCDYSIDAEEQPTRVVLRLEGKRSGDYTQLDATELVEYDTSMSGTQQLPGNLLDLPNLEAVDVSPTTEGNTDSVDLSIQLGMTVERDGSTLAENSVDDMVTVSITHGVASATVELGGSGSVSVSET